MPWFKKDEPDLPEALKGKTQEEIAEMLADAETLRSENATLKAQNADTNARFETFGTTLQELNSKVEQLGQPRVVAGDGGGNDERASFLTDPDRAFAERAAPLVGLMMSTAGNLAKQDALRQAQLRQRTQKNNVDGMLFEKFDSEIMELAKNCSAQQLAHSATWTHLFYNVKGRHADEIVTANLEKKGDFFVESSQRSPSSEVNKQDVLTEQEKRIAGKMGVSPEKYLERKKEMVVGAPENI